MPVSAHLLRKLQDSLGMDAASDLATIVESVDAIRADVAELRHELDVMKVRLDATATKADLKDALLTQTRWMLAGWATVLLAIYFRT